MAPKKGSKKAAHAKPKNQSKKTDNKSIIEKEYAHQMWAIIMFALGILFVAFTFVEGSSLWHGIHCTLFGLFGPVAFIIGPIIIYIAVLAALNKPIGKVKGKLWQTAVFLALICGAIQIIFVKEVVGENFIDKLVVLFENGMFLKGGGLLSALVGWPLMALAGTTGATIIIILLIFTFAMILSGSTLIGFFKGVSKPVKKIGDTYHTHREKEQNGEKPNIDIDLDGVGTMPEHPVSSPKSKKAKFDIDIKIPEYKPNDPTVVPIDESFDKTATPKIRTKKETSDANTQVVSQLDELIKKAVEETPEDKKKKGAEAMDIQVAAPETHEYEYPPINLLKPPRRTSASKDPTLELRENAEKLVATLKSFGVETNIVDICRGPAVTRYELKPSAGVKISKITNLADDIALNLAAAGVRIEAPIPNKAAVGIEIPNKNIDVVSAREIIDSKEFVNAKSKLSVALGRDIAGNVTVADLAKMPHMLIAGSTGSGKSVCINSIIMSILYKSSPDEVRLLMVDPKVVELGVYNGIPHLLVPVVTDPRKAAGALGWAVTEMLNRYKLFAENNVRDLTGYNKLAEKTDDMNPMPQIVIIIDELADLMMAAPNEVEDSICRLAQMARAAGMHLIIATQRPSVDVITGVIKANIPSRIAFAVSSQVDSRTIIDGSGAEKLLGRGDMLFNPVGMSKPLRVQGCFVSDEEVENVVDFIKKKEVVIYDEKIIEEIDRQAASQQQGGKKDASEGGGFSDDEDEMIPAAIECVIEAGQASTSYLQRKLKLGYARAARIIDELAERGIVGPYEGSKPRQVLITKQQWQEMCLRREDKRDEQGSFYED